MLTHKLIKVTFLKKPDQLIGTVWKEYPHWISAELINMLFVDEQTDHTILTVGAQQFHIKEPMDTVAAMVNGKTTTIKYLGEDVDVVVDESKSKV